MKKSVNQLSFINMATHPTNSATHEEVKGDQGATEQTRSTIEFLPCLFQSNVDESNKAIYFDSIVRDAEAAHLPQGMSNLPCKSAFSISLKVLNLLTLFFVTVK